MTHATTGAADDADDEAWIVGATSEQKIRLRSLTLYLERGGAVTDVRLVEGADSAWTIWVRLKDRSGEFRLNRFESHHPKSYKDVARAIATCREDFHYPGPITCVTDKVPGGPQGPAATAADNNFNRSDGSAAAET